MSQRTEKDRVLRALRRGPVQPKDFLAPTCDGGDSFLRLAARIYDLRQDGYEIPPSTKADDGTAVYRLVAEPQLVRDAEIESGNADTAGEITSPSDPAGQLFNTPDAPTGPRPHWQTEEAA